MEHRGMRLVAVGLYIIMLAALMKWNLLLLFDMQMVFFVLAGAAIYVLIDCRENATFENAAESAREAIYPAGMLCSILLIFYQCYETGKAGFSCSELALNLRPVFYSALLAFVLDKKDKVIVSDEEHPDSEVNMEHKIYFQLKDKGLTERETEVTKLMTKGLSNYEIGEELYITEATVKKHVTHIYEKLGVTGRRELIESFQDAKK